MGRSARLRLLTGLVVAVAVIVPTVALAHIERASYWPNPAPDRHVKPAAGGRVPKERSLASALKTKPPGRTRVVCHADSMKRLRTSIRHARRHGFSIRPHDHRKLTRKRARALLRINRRLSSMCAYHQIQPAVTASRNNDRVVVMPGLYTEPRSRKQPTDDPKCAKYRIQNDRNETGAVSYKYQWHCPNDQNLIAIMGRKPGKKPPPQPPRWDRHGIPDAGPCVRCNFQLEGSGVSADDVVIDAGRVKSGNHGPIGAVKDVGIRGDRTDGLVIRNLTVRHAKEHGIYVLESDGYVMDRFKVFYNGEYGVLTFVEDHGLIQNCEAMGSGDSGLYPGAGAETGEQRKPGTPYRYNQTIRRCDSHHNTSGYSGTASNAIHITHDNFYGNALGFTTDVFTAAGHPGFPQDSDLIDHNNFYSNNFNPYAQGSDVEPTVPVPVGTGLWIAGGNNNTLRDNHFFNNWRRGVMLFAVPDATVCGPQTGNSQAGCDPTQVSTSYRNQFHDNFMGLTPGGKPMPNGVDFWWDSFPTNTANCWYDNKPAPGKQIKTSPPNLPDCNHGRDPSSSMGTGAPQNEAELGQCLAGFTATGYDPNACPWFEVPPKPSG